MDLFFIIFSAGLGSRLKANFPKPLSPIINSKIIDLNINSVIRLLSSINVRNFVIYINIHKDADKIYNHILNNYYWLVKREKIRFLFEHRPLGHIGTINKLKYNILRYNKLILINSDTIIPNLEELLFKIHRINLNSIILHRINVNKIKSKTLTHFETIPHHITPFHKVKLFTKTIENKKYINLYTGVSAINLTKEISTFMLNKKFQETSFLDFVDFITNYELLGIFCPEFYEITTIKDLLKINVEFLYPIIQIGLHDLRLLRLES